MERYKRLASAGGLHYIAIALGSTIGSQVGGILIDRVWAYLKSKDVRAATPEYRVPMMIPGAMLLPLGLLLYGWSAERTLTWITTDIGIAIFTCGVMSSSRLCRPI